MPCAGPAQQGATPRGDPLGRPPDGYGEAMSYRLSRLMSTATAGYGAFNNKNMNLFLLSTGHGYGMVADKNGKETFMAMG